MQVFVEALSVCHVALEGTDPEYRLACAAEAAWVAEQLATSSKTFVCPKIVKSTFVDFTSFIFLIISIIIIESETDHFYHELLLRLALSLCVKTTHAAFLHDACLPCRYALVAACALEDPDVGSVLDEYASLPGFRGIRQIANKDPNWWVCMFVRARARVCVCVCVCE